MVEPRPAIGTGRQRPADGVLHEAGLVLLRRHFPKLLDADRVGLRVLAIAELVALDELLRQITAATFGEERIGGPQLHAELVIRAVLALLGDTHVAGCDADDAPVLLQQLGRGEARIDLDARLLGLLPEPAHHVTERDDVVAPIVHLRRRRQAQRTLLRQEQEPVLAHGRVQRRALHLPIVDQLGEAPRLDHGAGEDVRPYLAALLDDANARLRRKLLEPYGGGQPGRSRANNHHIEFHALALGHASSSYAIRSVCLPVAPRRGGALSRGHERRRRCDCPLAPASGMGRG